MKRSSSNSEAKRGSSSSSSSSQRLATAGVQAIEAHTRVRRFAERLGEELEDLEDVTLPHGDPPVDLGPEDPMVVAVEKAASTMKAVTVSMAAVSEAAAAPITGVGEHAPSTRLGVAPPSKPVVKTKLGVAPPSKRVSETNDE